MDPLSIITGSLAIATACGQTVKELEKLYNLRYASEEVLRLQNEVSDTRAILGDVERWMTPQHENDLANISQLIVGMKDLLQQVDEFIEYELMTPERKSPQKRVDKSTYYRREHRMIGFKNDIRSRVTLLHASLTAYNL